MSGFIAVHCGAGYHSASLHTKYKHLCKKACKLAKKVLESGGTAIDACLIAVMALEDNALTNAGFGSNLTHTGSVECDASVMDGETLNFGACGAVRGIKYPISLATQICKDQSVPRPFGLIPPSLLVGPGAHDYAKTKKLILIKDKSLISKKSYARYKRHKQLLQMCENEECEGKEKLDTVGAVCVDSRGHVASACSSGGIFFKYDGRVGQAATYASGVWADSSKNKEENSIAVTTSGSGEYLVKTSLAKIIAQNVKNAQCPVMAFQKTLHEDFLHSKYLPNIPEKLGGALVLSVAPSGAGDLIWGHTTETMIFAYMEANQTNATSVVSELPKKLTGTGVVMSGINFKINIS